MGVPHDRPLGLANYRWMTAILIFFMLGIQLVNAQSTSHLQLEHRHPAVAGDESAAGTGHQHEHEDDAAPADEREEHTHKHNPGDHTHDLPLRLAGATVNFALTPAWLPAIPVSVRSNTLYPLERPPRRRSTA